MTQQTAPPTPSPGTPGEGRGEGAIKTATFGDHAQKAQARDDDNTGPAIPRPQAHKKEGNGHGPRIEPDTAKPFAYGEELPAPAGAERSAAPDSSSGVNLRVQIVADPLSQQGSEMQADAPACDVCGSITVRSGTCYKCMNCGNSMGCS